MCKINLLFKTKLFLINCTPKNLGVKEEEREKGDRRPESLLSALFSQNLELLRSFLKSFSPLPIEEIKNNMVAQLIRNRRGTID